MGGFFFVHFLRAHLKIKTVISKKFKRNSITNLIFCSFSWPTYHLVRNGDVRKRNTRLFARAFFSTRPKSNSLKKKRENDLRTYLYTLGLYTYIFSGESIRIDRLKFNRSGEGGRRDGGEKKRSSDENKEKVKMEKNEFLTIVFPFIPPPPASQRPTV